MIYWILLFLAGLFEVVWAYMMKLSHGFTHLGYTLTTLIAMIISFGLLAYVMKVLPLGTSYMIWTGIGAVGAFILGVTVLGEPFNALRLIAAILIFSGIVLMKIATP